MAGVNGLEECHGLLAANLTEDDPVGPHAQCRGQEYIGGLELGVAVRDKGHSVRLGGEQFGGFFYGDDPLAMAHMGKNLACRDGLARRGAAGDDHVELVFHAELDGVRDLSRRDHVAQGAVLFPSDLLEFAFLAIEIAQFDLIKRQVREESK